MWRFRIVGVGLGLLALFGAGIGDSTAGGRETASETLARAYERLGGERFRILARSTSIDGRQLFQLDAVVDRSRRLGDLTTEATEAGVPVSEHTLLIGDGAYTQLTRDGEIVVGATGRSWVYTNLTRVPGDHGLLGPTFEVLLEPFRQVQHLERVGRTGLRGTVDLVREQNVPDVPELRTVPFEATVDDRGRLTGYTLVRPEYGGSPAVRSEVLFRDFGLPVEVTAPPTADLMENPLVGR
ncbi:hypothetical protein ACIBF5_24320 [Micromonospora sp. NPDC050417]|uniref:hypothetical protein n=1 Tax=Micromonospora sp. NPDC050417 TaxID=3364280 RepID=UPI0037B64A92